MLCICLFWVKGDTGQHNSCFKILERQHVEEGFNSFHMVPEDRNEAEAQQISVLNENNFLTISTTQKRHVFLLKGDNDLPTLGNDMWQRLRGHLLEKLQGAYFHLVRGLHCSYCWAISILKFNGSKIFTPLWVCINTF